MSDKSRAAFEEWIKGSALTQDLSLMPKSESGMEDIYLNPDANLAFFAWLAAKEKYEPRWISMDERAPSDRNPVLVYCPETVTRFTACYFEEDQEWIFFGASCETLTYQVAHWMPLPIIPPSTQGEE